MAEITSIPGFNDPFSSLSHLLGAGIFAVLSIFLLRRGEGPRGRVASLALFCFGAVFLLSMSGVYHLLGPNGGARAVMRKLDHAAIFVLIACSFTPIHVIMFRGWRRYGMLLLIWTIAVVFITLKMIYFDQIPASLNLALYLGMGWLGLFSVISLWRRYGFHFIQALLWGGVAYSVGAVFGVINWPVLVEGVVQGHEVFHVAVLLGLGSHWAFIYHIADGHVPLPETACLTTDQSR